MDIILIIINVPALINALCLFPPKKFYTNLHEFLFVSLDEVAL